MRIYPRDTMIGAVVGLVAVGGVRAVAAQQPTARQDTGMVIRSQDTSIVAATRRTDVIIINGIETGQIGPSDSSLYAPPDSTIYAPPRADSGLYAPPRGGIYAPPDSTR